jgi:hypothetical protein
LKQTPRYTVLDSEYKTLVFESKELYEQYKKEDRELHDKFYRLICETSGIWAGNQNKFVKTEEELNEWD